MRVNRIQTGPEAPHRLIWIQIDPVLAWVFFFAQIVAVKAYLGMGGRNLETPSARFQRTSRSWEEMKADGGEPLIIHSAGFGVLGGRGEIY